ncbi:exo-beta-N-acetylmuramidase NamZ family protein [Salegentibacter chungangensis]|uniref:Exo-beta-N-acetylmuramidase NamZ domain-containing protein n=1 Tax=Salegentibacter chungangensis TaxID=1335724 RepID=A0ABW3NQF5_9FLAO
MIKNFFKSTFLFAFIGLISCGNTNQEKQHSQNHQTQPEAVSAQAKNNIILAANRTEKYLPMLEGKKVALVGNQSSLIEKSPDQYTHVVDSLLSRDANLVKVFAPEHGFRGKADAGEHVEDGKDPKTGLPIISLYGSNKKPSAAQLEGIDVLIFDLQDVGARFYTYISSLHYVMEACAENDVELIVFDRPNPNGHYVDGPILDPEHQSFVGMHPIPVVHGLTMGEYARMINGEKWLKDGIQCDLSVIEMENYDHSKPYELPVKPSPNLPNAKSINLYPSLCFFEGTNVNAGRGTDKQFQVFGSPFLNKDVFNYTYTPQSKDGAKNPKHLGKTCYGTDLSEHGRMDSLNLEWLIKAYNNTEDKAEFFNGFFTKLAGGPQLQQQIEKGMSPEEIRTTWKDGLEEFNEMRKQYLLYN